MLCGLAKKFVSAYKYRPTMIESSVPAGATADPEQPTAADVPEMATADKVANLVSIALPFIAMIAAIVVFWNQYVSLADLLILLVMYVLTALGVTVGFHRLLTHRAFQTYKPVEYAFAVLGSLSVQGPVNTWVADHRKHHAHTDREGDPHSPHVGHGDGVKGVIAGLWHAHIGWSMKDHGLADERKYAKELNEDPGMRWISRYFLIFLVLSLAIPTAAGYLVSGTLAGAATGLLWGGLVRIFLVHHVTWSINSICHFMGTRRFDTDDHSTNVFWLALPSFGEAWHHNHHAFPRAADNGLRRRELDPSAWVITGLEKVGLAWNVVRISPERQRQRLASQGGSRTS
jgi:stearoyl-CoA desaturase (Delta-9 desaturase)